VVELGQIGRDLDHNIPNAEDVEAKGTLKSI